MKKTSEELIDKNKELATRAMNDPELDRLKN